MFQNIILNERIGRVHHAIVDSMGASIQGKSGDVDPLLATMALHVGGRGAGFQKPDPDRSGAGCGICRFCAFQPGGSQPIQHHAVLGVWPRRQRPEGARLIGRS